MSALLLLAAVFVWAPPDTVVTEDGRMRCGQCNPLTLHLIANASQNPDTLATVVVECDVDAPLWASRYPLATHDLWEWDRAAGRLLYRRPGKRPTPVRIKP